MMTYPVGSQNLCPSDETGQIKEFRGKHIQTNRQNYFNSLIVKLQENGLISYSNGHYKWEGEVTQDFAYLECFLLINVFFVSNKVEREGLKKIFNHNFDKKSLATICSSRNFGKESKVMQTLDKIFEEINPLFKLPIEK